MPILKSFRNSVWAAYIGDVPESLLARVLGAGAQMSQTPQGGLGVSTGGGEPAQWICGGDTAATARIGGPDAGCEATLVHSQGCPTLALACDPFGLHSIYTTQFQGADWFASDPRLLRRLPGVGTQMDPVGLHGFLCFSYVPTPHTAFQDIFRLPAGSRVRVTANGCQWKQKENSPLPPTAHTDQEQAIGELRTILRDCVRRRIDAETEVGVFLSGGLDSSLIAALLVEAGVKTHLFTLDFGPPFDAELPFARHVAAHLGQTLHVVDARPPQIRRALDATAGAMHQPFGDGVTVPLFLLGQAAKDYVGTVFNGEGGDQMFAGWTNKPMIAAELYGTSDYRREDAYLATFHKFYGLTDGLYTPRAQNATRDIRAEDWVRPALRTGGFGRLLHQLRAASVRLKGAQNIAPRAVQLTAAHGLRVFAPFFNRALWDWTCALPPEWFLQGACEKYLLKRAVEPWLPGEIVWREKRGMGVPTTDWCLGPLRRDIARRLSPRTLKRHGWFDPALSGLRRGEDQPGEFRRRRVGEKLWALLMLHIWQAQQDPPLDWP